MQPTWMPVDEQAAVDIQTAADLALRELGPRHELTLEAVKRPQRNLARSQPDTTSR